VTRAAVAQHCAERYRGTMPTYPADYVSVAEAADMLHLSVWTVARRIRSGDLPAVRSTSAAGSPWLIARADLPEHALRTAA
jgi:excisionase family DNA binding protein